MTDKIVARQQLVMLGYLTPQSSGQFLLKPGKRRMTDEIVLLHGVLDIVK